MITVADFLKHVFSMFDLTIDYTQTNLLTAGHTPHLVQSINANGHLGFAAQVSHHYSEKCAKISLSVLYLQLDTVFKYL
jgi:hypothetical protein